MNFYQHSHEIHIWLIVMERHMQINVRKMIFKHTKTEVGRKEWLFFNIDIGNHKH